MVEARTFDNMYDDFIKQLGDGNYQAAYDLLTQERDQYPNQSEATDYYRLCMLARLGDMKRLFKMFDEKMSAGFWYGEYLLRASPSFAPLQNIPEFESLVMQNVERQNSYQPDGGMIVFEPDGTGPFPTIIALHGNQQTNVQAAKAWRPITESGWLVGVPLSSQFIWKDAAIWDDYEIAKTDILATYQTLDNQHNLDSAHVILGGFSMGGETAIKAALEGLIPVSGFLVLGPGGGGMDDVEGTFPPLIESG